VRGQFRTQRFGDFVGFEAEGQPPDGGLPRQKPQALHAVALQRGLIQPIARCDFGSPASTGHDRALA